MLKRWEALTGSLRIPGPPLDNNLAEQALKLSVRYRNNSLFYKNQHCAFVGDVLSSLINGGTAGRGSENKVPFSTTRTAR